MTTVSIVLNNEKINVTKGTTILQAARAAGVHIPTLCKLNELDPRANCRMCVVEVQGARTLLTACSTKVGEGMVIDTDSEKVRKSRKMTLELILANHAVDCHHCLRIGSSKTGDLDPMFCEMCFFCDCVRDGFCELQSLARAYDVGQLPFKIKTDHDPVDDSTGSIIRNPSKCIKCRRCVDVCSDVQQVHNLVAEGRGANIEVKPAMNKKMGDSNCVQCGKCADVCPTGAIYVKEPMDELLYHTHNYNTTTVAQVSRNVLPELAELYGMKEAVLSPDAVVAGLRKIGVDYVYWDDYADALSRAEGEALIEGGLKEAGGPVIITDSYASQQFVHNRFSDMEKQVLVYPSKQKMFREHVVDGLIKDKGLSIDALKTINVTNTHENSGEAHKNGTVDICIGARTLYRIFLRTGVDLKRNLQSEADRLSVPEGGHAYDRLFEEVPKTMAQEPIEMALSWKETEVKAAVTTNLGQVKTLLDGVRAHNDAYKVIRLNA